MTSELSRREFLKLSGALAGSFLLSPIGKIIPQETQEEMPDRPFPFINQKNKSQCAVASMTMLIAAFLEKHGKDNDINKLYDEILSSFGRPIENNSSGVFGNELIQILKKNGQKFGYEIITENKRSYDPLRMDYLLKQNGPAIVDVNANYLPDTVNHWVVVVKIKEADNKFYINIADPARAKEYSHYLPRPSKTPKDMVFEPDGTIFLPWETFSDSAGSVFIQLKDKLGKQNKNQILYQQCLYPLSKLKTETPTPGVD